MGVMLGDGSGSRDGGLISSVQILVCPVKQILHKRSVSAVATNLLHVGSASIHVPGNPFVPATPLQVVYEV